MNALVFTNVYLCIITEQSAKKYKEIKLSLAFGVENLVYCYISRTFVLERI